MDPVMLVSLIIVVNVFIGIGYLFYKLEKRAKEIEKEKMS